MTTFFPSGAFEWHVLEMLPDDPFSIPDPDLLGYIDGAPEVFADAVAGRLDAAVLRGAPMTGYRTAHLVRFAGRWRALRTLPDLLRFLDTSWAFGWTVLVHAIVRMGGAAVTPLLFVVFDRQRPDEARCRALRSLTGIAVSAAVSGLDPAWIGDADAQRGEVIAALRVVLARHRIERAGLLREAAIGLCVLGEESAWDQVHALFACGALQENEQFGLQRARGWMSGHAPPFDVPLWARTIAL